MSIQRSLIFSLVMLMASVMPVAAAPSSGSANAETILGSHATACDDITIAADGTISVNGVALTAAQAALLSADARAALRLAANADGNANADICVDVSASLVPLSVVINADISICGSVVLTAGSATVGAASIPAELLSAGLREALSVAAAADVNACVTTTVTNNNVVTNVIVDACVQARLNSAGDVVVTAGGQDFVLDGFVISGTVGALNASTAVTIGLRIGARLNLATDAQTLTVQVVTITGCAATATADGVSQGGGSNDPGPIGSSLGTDSGTGGLLPDTAMEASAVPVAIPSLALIVLLLGGFLWAVRAGEVSNR